jgi:hypothetical protein
MRSIIVLLFMGCFSICLAQTDSMLVVKMNGDTIRYAIPLISQVNFDKPEGVREQELVQKVLSSFMLYQNYPNPFNPSTTIEYTLPHAGNVDVNIYDVQGRLVRSLFNSNQQVGAHALVWDSRNNAGGIVASGTYFCQVLFNGTSLVKKLVLIK